MIQLRKLACVVLSTIVLIYSASQTAPLKHFAQLQTHSQNIVPNFPQRYMEHTLSTEKPIKKESPRTQVSRSNSQKTMVVEATAYNWTGYRCASGVWPTDGVTIAMNNLPFGTKVFIPGVGERIVQDRPDDKTQLDIYMGRDKQRALKFGRQKLKIIVRD